LEEVKEQKYFPATGQIHESVWYNYQVTVWICFL